MDSSGEVAGVLLCAISTDLQEQIQESCPKHRRKWRCGSSQPPV